MAESRLSWPTGRGNSFLLPGFEGKRRTPLLAIRTFCLACMGGNAQLVTECHSTTCRLYAYRAGAIEPGADRRLLRVIKAYCAGQCLTGEDPFGCTAGKEYLDLGACSLWPYRRGRNPARAGMGNVRNLKSSVAPHPHPVSRSRIDEKAPGHSPPEPSFLSPIPCPILPDSKEADHA